MLKPQPVSLADVPPVLERGRVALEVVPEGLLEVAPEVALEFVSDAMVGLETITLGAGGVGFGRANNRRLFGLGALALRGVDVVGLPEGVVTDFASDVDALVVLDAPEVGLPESDFEFGLLAADWLTSGLIWADAPEAGFSAALALGMDGEGCTFGATVTTTVSAGRAGTRT
jgi:hypothetical protein